MPTTVHVTVPATTANIGPGFDCLGAALMRHNRLTVTIMDTDAPPLTIDVTGRDADRVGTDAQNLAYRSFVSLYKHLGQPLPAVHMAITLDVPLARGLGSSATAIVGGVLAANAVAGSPLSDAELMEVAIALEGHPDNVVPALLGGCQLTTTTEAGQWLVADIPWNDAIVPVLAIPDFELSTAEARRVLPTKYSRADAIFNTAHMGLLMRGLEAGNEQWLQAALQDRIHQPYRQTLIHHYDAVRQQAMAAGAMGLVISGAGPTLLALTKKDRAEAVCQAMASAWQQQGIVVETQVLPIEPAGATVHFA